MADDPPFGVPGEGRIVGRFAGNWLRFTKLLPELHLAGPDGSVSLRDYLATHDYQLQGRIAHQPIYYEGSVADDGSISGTWRIEAVTFRLGTEGAKISFPRSTGPFHMRKHH